jgi:hypothetical protein
MSHSRLVSFADDRYRHQAHRLRGEAEGCGWFDSVVLHDPSTVRDFLGLHRDLVEGSPGLGYWIWKPHIILRELEGMEDGDYLFYLDAGASVLGHRSGRFLEYLDVLSRAPVPVMGFADGGSFGEPPDYRERFFQKRRVLRRFGLEGDEPFLDSGQVEGGVVCVMRSPSSLGFLREWMDVCLEDGYSLLDESDDLDQFPGFLGHRHDQSLLSVLCKLRGAVILGSVECYGRGPFFSGRLTDEGPRPFAPDGFRREPDYDHRFHHGWEEYLSDPLVVEGVMGSLRGFISSLEFGSDPSGAIKGSLVPFLDSVQFRKGLRRVSLVMDEPSPEEGARRRFASGEVSCEFWRGDVRTLFFVCDSGSVSFPDSLPSCRRLYRCSYSREWCFRG